MASWLLLACLLHSCHTGDEKLVILSARARTCFCCWLASSGAAWLHAWCSCRWCLQSSALPKQLALGSAGAEAGAALCMTSQSALCLRRALAAARHVAGQLALPFAVTCQGRAGLAALHERAWPAGHFWCVCRAAAALMMMKNQWF